MKQFKLGCCCLLSAFALIFSSCGGAEEKKTSTDTAAAAPPAAAPVSTIVTTPQLMVVVVHKVSDYSKWEKVYEAHDSVRLASGLHKYVIGRGLSDSNMIMVAMKADDLAKAKAFAQSPGLKVTMKEAGVTGAPEIHFVLAEWQDTAQVGNLPRVFTYYPVKDNAAWKKVFESGVQERKDNGILMRIVGHDADDANKINLVTALSDTAKAFAYYKSDALKKRMTEGGVTGEPQRFMFRIAERY